MTYKLIIDSKATKDLQRIEKKRQAKIRSTIKTKLIENPQRGKKLIGNLAAYFSYLVGDYRVLYKIDEAELTIVVDKIKHRREVYKSR